MSRGRRTLSRLAVMAEIPDPAAVGSRRNLRSESIHEFLDHADELAMRFEDYEHDPGDERRGEQTFTKRAVLAKARGERQIVDAVTAARAKGISWQRIGELLGASAQAAISATARSSSQLNRAPRTIGTCRSRAAHPGWG